MAFNTIPGFSLPSGAQLCPSCSRFRPPQSSPLRFLVPGVWLFAALGMGTRNRETIQSTTPVFFLFLFVSNAFIPVATLPRWLQGFAANQPVSVFDNALRA